MLLEPNQLPSGQRDLIQYNHQHCGRQCCSWWMEACAFCPIHNHDNMTMTALVFGSRSWCNKHSQHSDPRSHTLDGSSISMAKAFMPYIDCSLTGGGNHSWFWMHEDNCIHLVEGFTWSGRSHDGCASYRKIDLETSKSLETEKLQSWRQKWGYLYLKLYRNYGEFNNSEKWAFLVDKLSILLLNLSFLAISAAASIINVTYNYEILH